MRQRWNALCLLGLGLSSLCYGNERYPTTPDESLTPGSTCQHPDSRRYEEQIPYCTRNVTSGRKAQIFARYDKELGYETRRMDRYQFKIDHYIPLCMGGSNDDDNLWPQHKTIYEKTDYVEGLLCELMAKDRMSQADAIVKIRELKADPDHANDVLRTIENLSR